MPNPPFTNAVEVANPYKSKGGRPSASEVKLLQSFRMMIYLYSEGKTTTEVCNIMGISRSTLMRLRTRYPQLWESVSKTTEMVDKIVEQSLFRRSVGYSYTTKKEEWIEDEDGNQLPDKMGRMVKKVTKEYHHLPPSVDAIRFWLRNRKPEKWTENITIDYADMKDGELFRHIEMALKDLQQNKDLDADTKKLLNSLPEVKDNFNEERFKKEVLDKKKEIIISDREVEISGLRDPENQDD